MDYGRLFSRAWEITWRNKVIWIFGFLAALGSGTGGGNFTNRMNIPPGRQPSAGRLPPQVEQLFARLAANPATVIAIVAGVILVFVLIGLVLALISALGHAGLVETVREADETGATSLAVGWRAGVRRMLPVFAVRLLLGLPTFLIIVAGLIPLILSVIPLATRGGSGGGVVATALGCFVPAVCIGLLLAIPLSVLQVLAVRALVLENQGIWSSIRRGWQVLTRNLGEVIVLWLILLVIGFIVGIVVGLVVAAIAVATIVPLGLLVVASPIFVLPLVLAILLLAVVSAAIRSVIEAFISAAWTLAYRQMTRAALAAPVPAPA